MNGDPPAEEDFSQIPLVERSQHKVSGSVLGEGAGKRRQEMADNGCAHQELESQTICIQRCHFRLSEDCIRYRPILPAICQ